MSGQLANTGFHVTASDTISLYAITQGNPNLEYTNIIPTHVLRSDYMVQSYPADRYSSEFVIVAAENNVTVTIQQRGNSSDGHTTGDIYNITIPQAGQVYQLLSTIPGDLSGTRITAQNNKKIAVFNGDQCIYVPNQPTGRSCDHVVEQAMPVDYWGRRFIAVASRSARVDYVRVTALNNNCAITVNGNLVATIGGGDTYEYRMSSTTSIDDIRTSQPAMAYIYFPSLDAQGDGDPSMTTIVPIEQRLQHMNFPIISSRNVHSHYANIICKTTSVNSMLLDGNPVGTLFTPIANAPDFSYLRQSLSVGSHSITNLDTSGYIAYIYGFGPRVSYGYSMGYACRTLYMRDSALHANGWLSDDSVLWHRGDREIAGCQPVKVWLRDSSADAVSVVWHFGDGTSTTEREASHVYSRAGVYTIMLEAVSDNGCRDTARMVDAVQVMEQQLANFYWEPLLVTIMKPEVDFVNLTQPDDSCNSYKWFFLPKGGGQPYDSIFGRSPHYRWVAERIAENDWQDVMLTSERQYTTLQQNTLLCFDTMQQTVQIANIFLQFPNVVTANGDGVNDRWYVVNLVEYGYWPVNCLRIYNRWGKLVFSRDNITSHDDDWDPAADNRPTGTYFFHFEAQNEYGSTERNGVIEVLR